MTRIEHLFVQFSYWRLFTSIDTSLLLPSSWIIEQNIRGFFCILILLSIYPCSRILIILLYCTFCAIFSHFILLFFSTFSFIHVIIEVVRDFVERYLCLILDIQLLKSQLKSSWFDKLLLLVAFILEGKNTSLLSSWHKNFPEVSVFSKESIQTIFWINF